MPQPTEQDVSNAAGLADFQKDQIEQSNGWPTGSLGRGGSQPSSAPGATVAGGSNPAVAGGVSTEDKRMRLVAASKQGTSSSWWTASPDAVEAEFARLQAAEAAGGSGGGGGGGGGGTGTNVDAANVAVSLANAAAQQAYLNKRLEMVEIPSMRNLDEREKERLAQEAARDAWTKAYQQGQQTGYVASAAGEGIADKAQKAWLSLPAAQQTPERAAAIWTQLAPGLTPQEAAQMAGTGRDYYLATGQVMPNEVAQAHLSRITGGRITGQPATLDRQKYETDTQLALLKQGAELRGPQDWLQYANWLKSIPDSVKGLLNNAAGRFPGGGAPQAATVAGMTGQINAAGAAPTPTALAPVPQMRYAQEMGGPTAQIQPVAVRSGVAGPGAAVQYSGAPAPVPEAGVPRTYGGPGWTGIAAPTAGAGVMGPAGLPAANQLPRDLLAAGPTARAMTMGAYDSSGQSGEQAWSDYLRSMPRYQGSARGVMKY